MLKKLFYASATILMLALAYHLGVVTATAQSAVIEGANIAGPDSYGYAHYSCAVGRTYYRAATTNYLTQPVPDPIPGTSSVVATGSTSFYDSVILANGDMYIWGQSANGNGWQYKGSLLALATSGTVGSFGQLKAQYRK